VTGALGYLADLGVTALWLSPIHPSPDIDVGYDVRDYTGVHPALGDLTDVDALVEGAHRLGLAVILDWVVNHTSDRHPWFVDARSSPSARHRSWYLFRPGRGEGPPNNWLSMFGGPAWTRDERSGEWYLHTFLPEQPDLNWRQPEVREAIGDAMRFWLERGVDGFRLDALPMLVKDDRLRDNPPDPRWRPGQPDYRRLKPEFTVDRPEMSDVVRFLGDVVDEYDARVLIAEMGLPPERLARYHASVDVPMNFGLITRPWTAERLATRIARYLAAVPPGAWPNWVLGNHDVSRVATRLGPGLARAAAVLLLTLPGTATLYYGDELGLPDNDRRTAAPRDRLGFEVAGLSRDPQRSPMPWNATADTGFRTGTPWLPSYQDPRLSVEAQERDPSSSLALYRRLLALRSTMPGAEASVESLSADGGLLSFRRGRYRVAANLGDGRATFSLVPPGRVVLSTDPEPSGPAVAAVALRPAQAVVVDDLPSSH
jgi:alpha-glucosidase